MARTRGTGGQAARDWESLANGYQRDLGGFYTSWARELAEGLAAEEDSREQQALITAALIGLQAFMTEEGDENIADGVELGFGQFTVTGNGFNAINRLQQRNQNFVGTSLIPDVGGQLREFIIGNELLTAALIYRMLLRFRSRVESYAGAVWGAINFGAGEASRQTASGRVYWQRNPRAKHCDDCLEHGEQAYQSFDEMLAITGGIAPGMNTQCAGNCRCDMLVEINDEFVRP